MACEPETDLLKANLREARRGCCCKIREVAAFVVFLKEKLCFCNLSQTREIKSRALPRTPFGAGKRLSKLGGKDVDFLSGYACWGNITFPPCP